MGKATKGTEKGSQWVFWPLQDPSSSASPEDLAAMDEEIQALKERMPMLKGEFKTMTAKLNILKTALTTSELMAIAEKLRNENAKKRNKLKCFQEGAVEMVKEEDVKRVERDLKWWQKMRKVRKHAFEGLEDVLRQGMSKEDIWEKAGLDEDVF
jgi:26S proteasome regulatory subunit (ATPase 3-interacting protein)